MLAPLALFGYKRLDHFQQTLESLKANHLASQSELFIFEKDLMIIFHQVFFIVTYFLRNNLITGKWVLLQSSP